VPVRLGGAWFLYAQAEFPGGKTRALAPALLTASQKTTPTSRCGSSTCDAQIDRRALRGREQAAQGVEPSREDIALLRQQCRNFFLQRTGLAEERGAVRPGGIHACLAEKYAEVFAQQDPGITAALSGRLRHAGGREVPAAAGPAGENVAQVMERKSMYVVHSATDSLLEGQQFTAYLAAGPGVPIPMTFMGPFKLYRLAKATGTPPPGSTARGRRSAR